MKGGEIFSIAAVVGVAGWVAYRLIIKPKYQTGDVLLCTDPQDPGFYLTVLSVGGKDYTIQEGVWPNLLGTPQVVSTKDLDSASCTLYAHVTISASYDDPYYYNQRTSTDDEGGVVDYELIPVTGWGSDGNGNLGIPKTDAERAMNHYGITLDQYLANPEAYPVPTRGTGLNR